MKAREVREEGIDGRPAMERPSSYRGEYAEYAVKLRRLGVTDQEIAGFFDVSVATLNRWKHVHPEFMDSMMRGKMNADAEVRTGSISGPADIRRDLVPQLLAAQIRGK